jgi:regulator of nucleoside diphosphate kinase
MEKVVNTSVTSARTKAKKPRIAIPAEQFERLRNLADSASVHSPMIAEFLYEELERAHLIRPGKPSIHVVQIGSVVEFREGAHGNVRRATLVYPAHADIGNGMISVLTPVGVALLGMMAGQTISYRSFDGKFRELSVLSVVNII